MISRIALFSCVFLFGCGGATLGTSGTDASDGGTQQDGGTPIANECPDACPSSELSWAWNGGLTSSTATSTLDCSAYRHDESSDSGDLSCTDTLSPSCTSSAITTPKVAQAFFDSDVTAAFAGTTTLYGSDPRGCDGSVLNITFQSKTISVGGDCSNANDCGGASACVPVPAGLKGLAAILLQLDQQEIKTPDCASVFPGR